MKFVAAPAMAAVLCLAGCATSPKDFYTNPSKASDTELCRAASGKESATYKRDLAAELVRRGVSPEQCKANITAQNLAIVAAVGVGVVAAAAISQSGGSGSSGSTDYDCQGGRGDGPLYVQGPVTVTYGDPYNLDADGDGIGCEATDMAYGL